MADRSPVIAGVGLSDYPVAPHLDLAGHHAQATQRALADCGLDKQDIDGYAGAGGDRPTSIDSPLNMAEYLGIDHRWFDGTMTGGSSFEFHLQRASAAIREGYCETVLITYASNYLSKRGRTLGTGSSRSAGRTPQVSGPEQYEAPFGNTTIGSYAMAAQRHMHDFGTTPEQLAEVAVAARRHAQLNPSARYRDPMTIDDVLNSRLVANPLHKLDCCATTDGGGAVIVTTAERARDLRKPPIAILGAAGAATHWNSGQMPDFTTTAAAKCGPEAFARAGVTPEEIDTVQLYDSFTITVLLLLEDLGFCAKGDGGPFVETGALRLGGKLPFNTDGGGLSSCHPGMRGIFLIIEAVRQLRGEAGEAQVPDCELALACGSGGWLSYMGAVIMGRG
jgi:acetyl-CoA acetyltransferase